MSLQMFRRLHTKVLPSVAELIPTQSTQTKRREPKAFQISASLEERAEKLVADSGHNLGNIAAAATDLVKRHGMDLLSARARSNDEVVGDHACLAYLVGRFPAESAALSAVFSEIGSRDPRWEPATCFDCSSKTNAVSWTATARWPGIAEVFCVDLEKAMLDLGEKFVPRSARSSRVKRTFFFRQFLPALPDPTFDLVVSSYASNSVLTAEGDGWRRTADILWQKTGKYLVFVEHGTNAGFALLNRVRDHLLEAGGSLVAPCPHRETCPRLGLEKLTPCAFGAPYRGFRFAEEWLKARNSGVEQYAYLVFRKGDRVSGEDSGPPMSRVVRPVQKRHRHAIMRLCCPDGSLREVIPSRGKQEGPDRDMWRFAKKAKWGDGIPVVLKDRPSKAGRPGMNGSRELEE